jgi:hypothetical protein
VGTARWRGRMYNSLTPSPSLQRIYRGAYGTAAYQSVYQAGGHLLDLLHQLGVPLAAVLLLTAPFGLLSRWLALPAACALVVLSVLATVDMRRAHPPRRAASSNLGFRAKVAVHHLLQPLVRWWARSRQRPVARRDVPPGKLPAPLRRLRGGVVVVAEDRPRSELAAALVGALRHRGIRATAPSGWEDYDARLVLSGLVYGELQTSSHPEGFVQIRIRTRPRWQAIAAAVAAGLAITLVSPILAPFLLVPTASLARGALRAHRLPAHLLAKNS